VRDYYEDLWQRLPDELSIPDFELRWRYLLEQMRPGDRVVDLGCGEGAFTSSIAQAGFAVVGIEVAQSAIERARTRHPGLDFRLAPVNGSLPLEDGSFNLVWATEVIEHIADTAPWLSEVRRVLAPRGRLLVTTPSHGRLRVALGGVERFSEPLGDHLHLYTRRSLRGVLEDLGFDEVEVRAAGGPPLLRRLLLARAVR
jgi:2-polyprenyl-3-methyl-5-hydroxy-6-metoxy-1,4-benzoquinol methylase